MPESPGDQPAPVCPYCEQPAQLVTGETVYAHRPDLAHKYFWLCAPCGAYVGSHPGTRRPLGTPAKRDLRRAHERLHNEVINPLWLSAPDCGEYEFAQGDERARKRIHRSAQPRVYRFLAHKLGLPEAGTHVGMFTLEQCAAARAALKGVTYVEIRDWDKRRQEAADAARHMAAAEQALPTRPSGPSRNRPCPCGSRWKYKQCCAPCVCGSGKKSGECCTPRAGTKQEP